MSHVHGLHTPVKSVLRNALRYRRKNTAMLMRPLNGQYICVAEDVRLLFGDNVFKCIRPKIATRCRWNQAIVTMCASHCVSYNPACRSQGGAFHAPSVPLTTGRVISTASLRLRPEYQGRTQVHTEAIMDASARAGSRRRTHHIATSPWLQSSTDLRRSVVSFSKRSRARPLSTSTAALAGLRPS